MTKTLFPETSILHSFPDVWSFSQGPVKTKMEGVKAALGGAERSWASSPLSFAEVLTHEGGVRKNNVQAG